MSTTPTRSFLTPDQHDLLLGPQADVFALWQDGLARADDEQVDRTSQAGRALRAVIMSLGGERPVSHR